MEAAQARAGRLDAERSGQRLFNDETDAAVSFFRQLIERSTTSARIVDPYFGLADLMSFGLANATTGVTVQVLTSAEYLRKKDEGSENVVRYALLQGGQFFIADIQLSKFDVVGSKGQLVPKWIVDEGCGFLQAPIAAGPVLFERLEAKLERHPGQLLRACIELAKDWRTDRYLRRLEAMLAGAPTNITQYLLPNE